jgi:hypothetical protein
MASKVQFKEFLDNNLLPTLVEAHRIGLDEHLDGGPGSINAAIIHNLVRATIYTAILAGIGEEKV